MRLIDGYRTDVLYSIRKENGWEGVKMERIMTNEKISGIIGGEKIPVHTEYTKELFLSIVLSLSQEEQRKLWEELRSSGYIN